MSNLAGQKDWTGKMSRPFGQPPRNVAVLLVLLFALVVPWVKVLFTTSLPPLAAVELWGESTAVQAAGRNQRPDNSPAESFRQWAARPVVPPGRNLFSAATEN